jgi:putative redox protein
VEVVYVNLTEGYRVVATARAHEWAADLPVADGGEDSAPTPEELLLSAAGTCMAETAKLYANRKGWPLVDVQIELTMMRINPMDYPGCIGESKFAHRISEKIALQGDLSQEQYDRILEIMRKCPVRRILANPVLFEDVLLEEPLADG